MTERWRPKELTDEETLALYRKQDPYNPPRIRKKLRRYSKDV